MVPSPTLQFRAVYSGTTADPDARPASSKPHTSIQGCLRAEDFIDTHSIDAVPSPTLQFRAVYGTHRGALCLNGSWGHIRALLNEPTFRRIHRQLPSLNYPISR